MAYEEEEEWSLLENKEALAKEGHIGTEKITLPYSTLWAMQLEREEQSHQEACEKYSKVTNQQGK